MTTYPLATLACTLSATGITAPSYTDILESLKASYRSIFGSDVYLEPDSQDGQWLAIIASAVNDTNAVTIATYNAFSPATAQGVGLSSVVQINGIARQIPTRSTADLTIIGTVGTVITNGVAADAAGNLWALPASVVIPISGSIVVTATCTVDGAISAAAATITTIQTPTLGWQTVNNVAGATEGAPVESDAALRLRQATSTALGAETPLKAISGAIAALPGVTRLMVYENDTGATDANGITEHSVAVTRKASAPAPTGPPQRW